MALFAFALIGLLSAGMNAADIPTCYNLGRVIAEGNIPCNPDASSQQFSLCCAEHDICLSNGLCWYAEGNQLSRGACTDPDWSGDCLLLRKDGTRTNDLCNENSASYGVARCLSGDHQGEFVCTDVEPEGQCNGTVIGAFVDLAPGYLADNRNASRASATASAPLAVQETVSVTATVTPTSKITPIPAPPPAPVPCPSETGEKAAIGAGIGVPLASALTAALLWAIWERRQRKRAQRTGYLVDIHENGAMSAIRSILENGPSAQDHWSPAKSPAILNIQSEQFKTPIKIDPHAKRQKSSISAR